MKYSDIRIVFASASPRRRQLAYKIKYITPSRDTAELLRARGIASITPEFCSSDVDEVTLPSAEDTAIANARKKGLWAVEHKRGIVLAFDTVVGVEGKVLGKPKDAAEAEGMFRLLCGRVHEVITAVFLGINGKIIEKSQKTYVGFGAFDDELVYNYIGSGAPFDKAGGYNIDDAQIKPLITYLDGDYDNVVGLPVALVEKLIEENIIYGEDGYSD